MSLHDEPSDSARLTVVSIPSEIRENIKRFCRDAADHLEQLRSALHTSLWVYDPAFDNFGPAEFVAYRSMTWQRYELALAGRTSGAVFGPAVAQGGVFSVIGDFQPNSGLTDLLFRWSTSVLGEKPPSAEAAEQWRFAELKDARQYWSALCDPDRFRAVDATTALDELVWAADRGEPRIGDRILLWQAKGKGTRRGVVALGEITAGPEMMEGPAEERAFWRDDFSEATRSIRFRVFRAPGLPLWEHDAPWLGNLTVAKGRGRALFNLDRAQWWKIARHVQLELSTGRWREAERRADQGYFANPKIRKAVEMHAQRMIEDRFADDGYSVEDVSLNRPYDLLCRRGDEELHVEVKGTTNEGDAVFLTMGEVKHARTNRSRMVLAIVRMIRIDLVESQIKVSGGTIELIRPWVVDEGELQPLQFKYRPPAS